jgi:hypothetical protein
VFFQQGQAEGRLIDFNNEVLAFQRVAATEYKYLSFHDPLTCDHDVLENWTRAAIRQHSAPGRTGGVAQKRKTGCRSRPLQSAAHTR